MVKPATILRTASILALLQYVAHALLFLSATPAHGPDERAVIAAMQSHRFGVAGFARSYWDFYFGYGLLSILCGVIEVVVLWQVATQTKRDPRGARPLVWCFMLANVAHAILVWRYFALLAPVIFDVVIAVCLGWTLVMTRLRVGED